MPVDYLLTKDAARRYKIPEGTLANLRFKKRGPRYFRRGRRIIYRSDDIERWLESEPVLTLDSLESK